MITVEIRGLEFYGWHGVPDAEQEIGHRYRLDVWLEVDSMAEATDDVAHTVDYGALAQELVAAASSSRRRTLERLAYDLCQGVLERHVRVAEVKLRVAKRLPPAPVIAEETAVTLVRRR